MKTFIKKNIRFIIIVVICITCSVLTTFATDYLFNSSEVYYNNATSGIQADKVQGAIDELYACASNYAAYNQRLTSAENTIGSGSLTTTSQNLIGAVNGLNDHIVALNNKVSDKVYFKNIGAISTRTTKQVVLTVLQAFVAMKQTYSDMLAMDFSGYMAGTIDFFGTVNYQSGITVYNGFLFVGAALYSFQATGATSETNITNLYEFTKTAV